MPISVRIPTCFCTDRTSNLILSLRERITKKWMPQHLHIPPPFAWYNSFNWHQILLSNDPLKTWEILRAHSTFPVFSTTDQLLPSTANRWIGRSCFGTCECLGLGSGSGDPISQRSPDDTVCRQEPRFELNELTNPGTGPINWDWEPVTRDRRLVFQNTLLEGS